MASVRDDTPNERVTVPFERPERKESEMMRKYRSAPPPGRTDETQPIRVVGRNKERRRADRWSMDADVEIVAPSYQRATPINGSASGVRVAVQDWIPAGADCDVRFKTRSGRVLVRRATVVWARRVADGCVVGMRFIGRIPHARD